MNGSVAERRLERSNNPAEALVNWLEASRLRANVSSLALADKLGILVAGAGAARECDELAAWAPLVLEARDPSVQGPFELRGVKLPGFEAYVCAPSTPGCNLELLSDAAEGCARILGRPSRICAND